MRRLSDLRPRSAKRINAAPVPREECPRPNNDIVYLLSRLLSGVNRMYICLPPGSHAGTLKRLHGPHADILSPWKKSYERWLSYDIGAKFKIDLRPFVNLRSLKISGAEEFDVCGINNTGIAHLELHNVKNVFLGSGLECVSLESIYLKEVRISLRHLLEVMKIRGILSIGINRAEIAAADWKHTLLKEMGNMEGLRNLEISHMNVDPHAFRDLCRGLNLASFKLADENVHAEADGSGVIRFKNTLELFKDYGFELVESLQMAGADIRHFVGMELPALRSMKFHSAIIDMGVFRSILTKQSTVEDLSFVRCVFDQLSFYEIVVHFRGRLRRLNLMSSVLPHDYLSFLSSKLCCCTAVLVDGSIRTIRNT
jgi:hypothetical protein